MTPLADVLPLLSCAATQQPFGSFLALGLVSPARSGVKATGTKWGGAWVVENLGLRVRAFLQVLFRSHVHAPLTSSWKSIVGAQQKQVAHDLKYQVSRAHFHQPRRRTFSPVDQKRWDVSTGRTYSSLTCNWHCTKDASEQTTSLALSAAEDALLPISSPCWYSWVWWRERNGVRAAHCVRCAAVCWNTYWS